MPPWTLCGHSPAISLAQHCKTLHWVKPAILAQEPRLAWAGHLIAPPPGFAQFSNAKPVGGRGISDFLPRFFLGGCIFRIVAICVRAGPITYVGASTTFA